ncbi:lytic transglycosylase domain-containing protein [Sulfurihydrogenibium sp.]|uniref:lytic transglycosylase domain-containing protein n=1 Tax=Sulfurihydrogenibium sp. TaxID=2053621 RepID=UPI002601EEEE|nr:lytic transglycosylase domain-containing protein [Sulfurihydrogenibium sp.]
MKFLKLIYAFSIGLFLSSCSVQVKDVKKSYKPPKKVDYKYTYTQNTNTKIQNSTTSNNNINTDSNDSKTVLEAIKYGLSETEKNYITQEAKILGIQIPDDQDIEYFINYFTTTKKSFTENALKRANYFLPMVKRIFMQEGLPPELAYLAVVESGFNPYATSPSNAAGIWQFIPSTGRRFGLRIDEYVDERRDPYKSTIAAAKYLKFLYNMFGSWELAIAGYNCGEKCVAKRLEANNTTNFKDIKYNLPSETSEYVPRFFAILIIANNPEKYGLDTKSNVYDVVNFTADREIHLSELSQEKKIDYDILKFYNAHLKTDVAFEGININLPKLNTAEFDRRFITTPPPKLYANNKKSSPKNQVVAPENKEENIVVSLIDTKINPTFTKTNYKRKVHIVSQGETLYSIAKKYGVDVETIRKANNLEDNTIYVGMELVIP